MDEEIKNIKQKLLEEKKTYITLEEIKEIIGNQKKYKEIANIIKHFINDGILKAVGLHKNGKIPSLFLKYRIIKQEEEQNVYTSEIQTLCNVLNIEEYLKRPKVYEKHRELLLTLNTFLIQNKERLKIPISKNERAYQIWNDEKILDAPLCRSIIKWNNLEKLLNYYLTPEPFFDYIHTKKEKMTILIIENKDTWYTMRKVMNEKKGEIYLGNIEINGLLYGEGNKITKLNAVQEYEKEVIQTKCNFIYWGDLDYTGIEMFKRVVTQNKNANISLFSKIYEIMIDTKEIEQLGTIKNKQNHNINLDLFLNFFNMQYQNNIKLILKQNKYIPQEIINAEILKKICKEKGSN